MAQDSPVRDDARMTYRQLPPAPELAHAVAAYWSITGVQSAPHRVLPDGCADLICDLHAEKSPARWVGTMTQAIEVPALGKVALFGVRFRAGGLFALLGAPLWLLTDRAVNYDDMRAQRWRPPVHAWQSAPDFATRCALADASLGEALARCEPSSFSNLLGWLDAAGSRVTLRALIDRSGVGQRTVQRRFMDHVGVSPRQHLRYLRFQRARCLLEKGGSAADIALAVGYSDQAHFVRDFRRFAGITPGRWR